MNETPPKEISPRMPSKHIASPVVPNMNAARTTSPEKRKELVTKLANIRQDEAQYKQNLIDTGRDTRGKFHQGRN